jgi:5-methylcytosine-specific restriction endonuclease McrA
MTRKSLKNKCDKLWREAIWARDNDSCAYCGAKARNAHHLIGKRNHRLRWDLSNGINLCPDHHTFSTEFSAHQTSPVFDEWFENTFPDRDFYLKEVIRNREFWDKDYEKVMKCLEE